MVEAETDEGELRVRRVENAAGSEEEEEDGGEGEVAADLSVCRVVVEEGKNDVTLIIRVGW